MLGDSLYVDFNGKNAHDYYAEKYGEEKILCDETHFNDFANEEMVRDFIAPILERAKKIVNVNRMSR